MRKINIMTNVWKWILKNKNKVKANHHKSIQV